MIKNVCSRQERNNQPVVLTINPKNHGISFILLRNFGLFGLTFVFCLKNHLLDTSDDGLCSDQFCDSDERGVFGQKYDQILLSSEAGGQKESWNHRGAIL